MSNKRSDLEARYNRLQALYRVGGVIHSTLEPQAALQLILDQAVSLMRAASGSVVLINPTTGLLEIHALKALPAKAAELRLRIGEGITGWVARTGQPARVGDVRRDARSSRNVAVRCFQHAPILGQRASSQTVCRRCSRIRWRRRA